MIIDDKHQFVFLHIPKCAGTSIRSVLEKFDTTNGMFKNLAGSHQELGRVDMGHLPLFVLRQYYSNEYEKIRAYHSVAVLRDPLRRFSSSLYQRLSMYGSKPVKQLNQKEMHQALDKAIAFLTKNANAELLPYDYIHFQKQHTYVFDQGERLIDCLYTPCTIHKLFEDVGGLLGERLVQSNHAKNMHANKAVFYKSSIFKHCASIMLPLYSKPVQHLLPESFKKIMKNIFYESKDTKLKNLLDSDYVRAFISEYYAEDISLYKAIEATYAD